MDEKKLMDERDDIIRKIRELQEDLKFINDEISRRKSIEHGKPEQVYNNYRSW